jgi:hypothetical protein
MTAATRATSGATTRHNEPFAALPHHIAGDPRVSPLAKAVLLALLYWARGKDHCWPADASIGQRVGRSVATVQRALRQLQVRGLIDRRKTDANRTGRIIVLTFRARTDEQPPRSPVRPSCSAALRDEGDVTVKQSDAGREIPDQMPERPRPDPVAEPSARPLASVLAQVLEQVQRPSAAEPPAGPPPVSAPVLLRPPAVKSRSPRVLSGARETARVPGTDARSTTPSASLPSAAATAPAVPLTPAEQARLAELAPTARDKVLAWLATGDQVCLGEARRLLAPPPPPEPEPRTTAELLGRLPGRPELVARAAQALAEDLGDSRSWSYYARLAGAVACRERPAEVLLEAWREARGPNVRSRGAIFVTSWRRSTRPSGP